ncbi:MAG: multidrug efflux SMR transporter [Micropruina sp.]|uniref:DMT family transporter n=1 Tax=Micropruina sp. TaxID=2737536 RepID=UPI0039E53D6D
MSTESAERAKGTGMNGWLWLLIAGAFEIGMTTALKLEQQNSQFLWVFLACAIAGFECLAKAIKTIPLGLAYAIWTGIGAVGTVIVGAVAFGDPLGGVRMLLLTGLVAAMIGLKLVGGRKPADTARR